MFISNNVKKEWKYKLKIQAFLCILGEQLSDLYS